jgi:hypothetical protein
LAAQTIGKNDPHTLSWQRPDYLPGNCLNLQSVLYNSHAADGNICSCPRIESMKADQTETSKPSQTEQVEEFLQKMNHPLTSEIRLLRQIILSTDASIGEEIKWNAPSFFYTGPMKPFNPKEFKRHFIVFNLFKKDCIRLVLPTGAKLKDPAGLLKGDYQDGRRLALFSSLKDIESKQAALQEIIQDWLQQLDH